MQWKVLYEPFRSYGQLIDTLEHRENNKIMQNCHSSQRTNDYKWFGTHNYKEAVKLLSTGYMEICKDMQKNVAGQTKLNSKLLQNVDHAIPHNAVVGFIPNVPAAIQNLPQSMISVNKKPMKRKTLHIIYGVGGSAMEERSYFEKAGTALLSAVDIIERCGNSTKIDLAFFLSKCGNEFPLPTVCIKNYGERFSIQKVSFPLVHTSMFRRIGFRWLETTSMITNEDFKGGYGQPPSHEQSEEAVRQVLKDGGVYISNAWINNHQCSVEEIMKKLEVLS